MNPATHKLPITPLHTWRNQRAIAQRTPLPITPLDREMQTILAQLELISTIPAANPNGPTANTDESKGGNRPPGDYGHLPHAERYGPPFANTTGCTTDDERRDCIHAAQLELDHLRKTSRTDNTQLETPEQTRQRMLNETEGWTLKDVALSHWRTAPSIMRRLRITDGRDAETGKPIQDEPETQRLDLASRARTMKNNGMSLRQIGVILGVDKQQVQRFLKRVA